MFIGFSARETAKMFNLKNNIFARAAPPCCGLYKKLHQARNTGPVPAGKIAMHVILFQGTPFAPHLSIDSRSTLSRCPSAGIGNAGRRCRHSGRRSIANEGDIARVAGRQI
jgi:hypothetical protein